MFDKPIINCQPNGQIFKKHVTLTISFDSGKEISSGALLVLHGTPTNDGKIFWEDITHDSKIDLEKEELKVEIAKFSLIAVLLRLTWVQTKEIVTRLNLMPFKYMLSVLFKSNHQHSPYDELALVFMSQDIYQEQWPTTNDNDKQECIILAVDSSVWWSTGHVIKLPLQGSCADAKILCGRIAVQGEHGHIREEHFCQLEYSVKERGQMHIEHIRELAVTILGLQHKDPNMMKYLGVEIKKLCKSVLRDCCIEIETSKEGLHLATSTEYCASLLEVHRQISKDLAKKYGQMCWSPEESITENFLVIVPQLVQAVKEIFRDEGIPQEQSGLRGVAEETILNKIASGIQAAAQNKNMLRLSTEVCSILEHLCPNNNANRSTEYEIRKWGRSAMFLAMLNFLEKYFQSFEARRLYKRLEIFSVSLRDIMSNPNDFEGSFLSDFHNVAMSLLKFAKFDQSQLVRFELNDPANSSNTQGNDGLKYDKPQEIFSQLFWISKECEDELQLEAVARVHIDGHIRSIGAFESLIIFPASYSETLDRVPIASLSVAVKREQDDSENLRVTLYATKEESVKKALTYLENELGADVVDLKRTEITQSHLKMSSFAKAGTVVRLRLVHRWGSETLALESSDFVALADSTAGGACAPDPEIAAEFGQLAIRDELPALPIASDSTVGNYSSNFVMDPSDAELIQRHLREKRGHVEFHFHQNFLKGHVCVAGENTRLNMQLPATEQRFLEAGPSAAPHKSITAGTGTDEV